MLKQKRIRNCINSDSPLDFLKFYDANIICFLRKYKL